MNYGSPHTRAKEPAVTSAERLMEALMKGDVAPLYHQIDPRVVMTSPMGVFHSRPHVKAWLTFEISILKGHRIEYHGTHSEDGLKTARNEWSVAGLHFSDTVSLSQVLSIKSVRRTMQRTGKAKEETQELLLAWTGPYFAKFCTPKKFGVDNRALVLPVLDYTYMSLQTCRELTTVKPREGKEISDPSIALHFLANMNQRDAHEAAQQQSADQARAAAAQGDRRDEITIRAKNRDGEQAAIVVDRSALMQGGENRVESLEDSEVIVRETRRRFVASGIKLSNNLLTNANDLDQMVRIYILNAFYFLTWVDLSSNQLTSIPDLSQYPIVVLYLHNNKIANMNEVAKLQPLTQLQSLTLFGNPIQCDVENVRDYKYRVLSTFVTYEKRPGSRPHSRSPPRSREDNERRSPSRIKRMSSPTPDQQLRVTLKSFDHSVISPNDKQNVLQYATVLCGHDLPARYRSPSPRSFK